jgi:hypothetical protein
MFLRSTARVDRGRIALDAGVNADPHGHPSIGHDRPRGEVGATVLPLHVDEVRLGRHPTILNHVKLGAHLVDPFGGLPRRDRLVMPRHEQALLPIQRRPDFLAL